MTFNHKKEEGEKYNCYGPQYTLLLSLSLKPFWLYYRAINTENLCIFMHSFECTRTYFYSQLTLAYFKIQKLKKGCCHCCGSAVTISPSNPFLILLCMEHQENQTVAIRMHFYKETQWWNNAIGIFSSLKRTHTHTIHKRIFFLWFFIRFRWFPFFVAVCIFVDDWILNERLFFCLVVVWCSPFSL